VGRLPSQGLPRYGPSARPFRRPSPLHPAKTLLFKFSSAGSSVCFFLAESVGLLSAPQTLPRSPALPRQGEAPLSFSKEPLFFGVAVTFPSSRPSRFSLLFFFSCTLSFSSRKVAYLLSFWRLPKRPPPFPYCVLAGLRRLFSVTFLGLALVSTQEAAPLAGISFFFSAPPSMSLRLSPFPSSFLKESPFFSFPFFLLPSWSPLVKKRSVRVRPFFSVEATGSFFFF